MNKAIKYTVVAFVLLGAVFSLGAKFWADGERIKLRGPSLLHVAQNNLLAVAINESIYFFDKHENTKKILHLKEMGITFYGDFAFFNNGDILVYNRKNKPNALDNIIRYLRIKEPRNDVATSENGFFRCNIHKLSCTRFTGSLPELYSSFRLYIDKTTDEVYVSDGQRSKIFKLNKRGDLLAQTSDRLILQNQVLLDDGLLYIANTNHHEIKVIDPGTDAFGEEMSRHKTMAGKLHKWPSDFQHVGDNWWVLIAGPGMADARVKIFDDQWGEVQSLSLPIESDAFGIEYYNNKAWITDWSNYEIYRFANDGIRLEDFDNPEFDESRQEWSKNTKYYQAISKYGMIGFVCVLVIGVISAFVLEKKETLNIFKPKTGVLNPSDVHGEMVMPSCIGVYWIENKYKWLIKPTIYASWLLVSGFMLYFIYALIAIDKMAWPSMVIIFFALVTAYFSVVLNKIILSMEIGVLGRHLIIKDSDGVEYSSEDDPLRYADNLIAIGPRIVMLKNRMKYFYPENEIKKWVYPRLKGSLKISRMDVLRLQLKQPYMMKIGWFILFMIIFYVYLKLSANMLV